MTKEAKTRKVLGFDFFCTSLSFRLCCWRTSSKVLASANSAAGRGRKTEKFASTFDTRSGEILRRQSVWHFNKLAEELRMEVSGQQDVVKVIRLGGTREFANIHVIHVKF